MHKVPKPSEYDMPYQEETLTTSDKIKIRIYVIQQGNDIEACRMPTILFFHVSMIILNSLLLGFLH